MDLSETDLAWFRWVFDLAQTLALVVLWLRKPGQDAGEKVVQLKGEVDILREAIRHMPLRDEVTKLEGSVSTMKSDLAGVRETAMFTREAVIRIEAFLLQAGTRKPGP
jgi:hypothetical protein